MRKVTPNAPWVLAARPSSIWERTGGGISGPPSMPRPPASATARTRGGVAMPPMPASWSGARQPTRFVKRVDSMSRVYGGGEVLARRRSGTGRVGGPHFLLAPREPHTCPTSSTIPPHAARKQYTWKATAILPGYARAAGPDRVPREDGRDRKSTRLNSSHLGISYAVFCLKKKKKQIETRK